MLKKEFKPFEIPGAHDWNHVWTNKLGNIHSKWSDDDHGELEIIS